MVHKEEKIKLYSNPAKVRRIAHKYGVDVEISTRKDKKYMLLNPRTNKWVHFGQMGYEDYTKHLDKNRRKLFLIRNAAWEHADKYSPAWASWHILW
jgi:hypothetical protein